MALLSGMLQRYQASLACTGSSMKAAYINRPFVPQLFSLMTVPWSNMPLSVSLAPWFNYNSSRGHVITVFSQVHLCGDVCMKIILDLIHGGEEKRMCDRGGVKEV